MKISGTEPRGKGIFSATLSAALSLSYTCRMRTDKSQCYWFFQRFLLAGLALLLSGCLDSGYWIWRHQEDLSEAQLLQAKKECRQLAKAELYRSDYYYPYYPYYPYYYPYYQDHYYRRGHHRYNYWRPPYYDFYRYNRDSDRLYKICMQAKGWQLVRIETTPQ